jgi:predicted nucleotidyltransferase
MEAIHLDADQIAAYCRRHRIRRLSLYGSVVTGGFRSDSDVDVLVEFVPGQEPDLFTFAGMEDELAEMLDRRVDLRTPEDLSHYFRDRVVAEAQVQYAA